MYIRYSQSRADFQRSQAALTELEIRQSELEKNIRILETNRGIENELRTRFNSSKEGEELIVIVSDKNQAEAAESVGGDSWWQKVKDWWFK